VTCPFGFPGQIRDPDTGFSYNRNRFYWPETAHYLTPDPVGIWGGLDNYRYTYDPINIIDPDGLKCRGKTDDDLLYRGTNMPPAVICKGGFVPKDPNAGLTVYGHIEGVPETGSNWISTTYDQGIAEKFADMAVEKAKYEKAAKDPNFEVGEPWVYIFLNPGCGVEVDCDPDLMKKYGPDPKDTEHEIAFNRSIPPKKIVGYYHKEKGMASFQGCP
jgi:RHS repeat-associated protein